MKIHIALLAILALQACKSDSAEQPAVPNTTQASSPSNRVAIPPAVRSNLGITFATTERRPIQDTLRAPGKFEYLPSAKREYLTMLPGKIELAVDQFDSVDKNTLLYTIDSPRWREIQQSIAEDEATIQQLQVKLETFTSIIFAHEHHQVELDQNINFWQQRIETLKLLREAGGGSMSEFTSALNSLAVAKTNLDKAIEEFASLDGNYKETLVALRAAKTTRDIALESASTMLNIPIPEGNQEWWKDIKQIEVRAAKPGIIESIDITSGAWADERTDVLTIVQPDRLRFHASGLQSDLGILRNGLEVYIVPPTPTSSGNSIPLQSTMHGTLQLGLAGDSNDRTIDLYVAPDELTSWARPGVSAQLEIVTDSTSSPELAIPLAAVQQDGLTPVIFRRNPDNPDEAIRMEADLGLNDGRWVAILSGLRDGDQVVLDGGFQLMLATSGSIEQGGHFHSDGTFHEGEH